MAVCLYIHIPFCLRKCIYCDFVSIPFNKSIEKHYIDALKKEAQGSLTPPAAKEARPPLKTIYIGGGTPSLLSSQSIKGLFKALNECFKFSPGAEITIEANPGTVDLKKIKAMLSSGINRLSIGVQSFNDDELLSLGRLHTAQAALKAVETARKAGIKNLSLDLIYGIPGQTLKGWRHTLQTALRLRPEHISAYELTPEKGTSLYRSLGKRLLSLPEEALVVDIFNYAIDCLKAEGFRHYEISNYSLPGYECRHNMNYWQRGEYIGLGAASHSLIGGKRLKNTADVLEYIRLLSKGILPVKKGIAVSSSDAIKEFIFLGLRMTKGISLKEIENRCPQLIDASIRLRGDGLLELKGNYLRLTRKGMPVSNSVIVELFRESGL